MVKTVFEIHEGNYIGFAVSGHAGYAEHGMDVCCAAVSSAVQTVTNAITEIFVAKADVVVEENRVAVKLTEKNNDASRLMAALHLQMELLKEEFEKNITIVISEV